MIRYDILGCAFLTWVVYRIIVVRALLAVSTKELVTSYVDYLQINDVVDT